MVICRWKFKKKKKKEKSPNNEVIKSQTKREFPVHLIMTLATEKIRSRHNQRFF